VLVEQGRTWKQRLGLGLFSLELAGTRSSVDVKLATVSIPKTQWFDAIHQTRRMIGVSFCRVPDPPPNPLVVPPVTSLRHIPAAARGASRIAGPGRSRGSAKEGCKYGCPRDAARFRQRAGWAGPEGGTRSESANG